MTAVGDHRLMANADSQYETFRRKSQQQFSTPKPLLPHRAPDIGNSGGNREALGMAKQIGRMGKGIAARALRYPESLVAMLLDRLREIEGFTHGHRLSSIAQMPIVPKSIGSSPAVTG